MDGPQPDPSTAPVLVVGGGVVGISTALFLAWHRVPVLVVERQPGVLIHPRARIINPRSVELYRQAGADGAVLGRRSHLADRGFLVLQAETLAGAEHHRTEAPPLPAGDDGSAVSPCSWAPIDQDLLEITLRERAEHLGAQFRFGTDCVAVAADADGVDATLRSAAPAGAGEWTVRADYLVAADGSQSSIRRTCRISRSGAGQLGHTASLVFEADLTGPLRGRDITVCHLAQPTPGTVLLPHDRHDRWILSCPYRPEDGQTLTDFSPPRCQELVRAAVGVPDLPVRLVPQLPDGTTVLGYEIGAWVADRFRAGRVFLAGDAAHTMPPTGALGAGTGIQDAHNLAWKLAAVLSGQAGPGLLDSYDAERRPAAIYTLGQAMAQMRQRSGRRVPGKDQSSVDDYDAAIFGIRYESAAVVGADPRSGGTALDPSLLTGQPGSRAPHVPLRRDGTVISSLDLYGPLPVVLAGPSGRGWAAAARTARTRLGLRLSVLQVGRDLEDPAGRWATAHGVSPAGCLLVRPDGIVGWRAAAGPGPAAAEELTEVLVRLAALPAERARVSASGAEAH